MQISAYECKRTSLSCRFIAQRFPYRNRDPLNLPEKITYSVRHSELSHEPFRREVSGDQFLVNLNACHLSLAGSAKAMT
jgi:hypothetical protein